MNIRAFFPSLAAMTLAGCLVSEEPLVSESEYVQPLKQDMVALTKDGVAEFRRAGPGYLYVTEKMTVSAGVFDIGHRAEGAFGLQFEYMGDTMYQILAVELGGDRPRLAIMAPKYKFDDFAAIGVEATLDGFNYKIATRKDLDTALSVAVREMRVQSPAVYDLLPSSEKPRLVAQFEDRKRRAASLCDELAANPADPGRTKPGVTMEALEASEALPACRDAVKYYPDTARFHYQLGRAQQVAGDAKTAAASYEKAAKAGHAMGWYNLAFLADEGKLPKDRLAEFVEKAAAAGIDVAAFGLGGALVFDANGYAVPALFEAIYAGDARRWNSADYGLYLTVFAGMFNNADDSARACRALISPGARGALVAIGSADMLGKMFGPLVEAHRQGSAGRDEAFGDGARAGFQSTLSLAQAEALGERDAQRFYDRHGCASPVALRFFRNFNAWLAK